MHRNRSSNIPLEFSDHESQVPRDRPRRGSLNRNLVSQTELIGLLNNQSDHKPYVTTLPALEQLNAKVQENKGKITLLLLEKGKSHHARKQK